MATAAQSAQLRTTFLKHFRRHGNVSWACRLSGLPRRTLYDWLDAKNDDPAAAAFREQYRDAELEATDKLEEIAWRRAMGYRVVKVKTEILRDRLGNAVLD